MGRREFAGGGMAGLVVVALKGVVALFCTVLSMSSGLNYESWFRFMVRLSVKVCEYCCAVHGMTGM